MDNDILWVWQPFGFVPAVEKAREGIDHPSTEVLSNPRLCVIQLFGSDSGFAVSHAVLASRTGICDAALIPVSPHSMEDLAEHMWQKMDRRMMLGNKGIPYGLVVLAETAIPTDALEFIGNPSIGLSDQEKEAVREFCAERAKERHIQGQTDDALRTAGLKIVSRDLYELLRERAVQQDLPQWDILRMFTSESRRLLRHPTKLLRHPIRAETGNAGRGQRHGRLHGLYDKPVASGIRPSL